MSELPHCTQCSDLRRQLHEAEEREAAALIDFSRADEMVRYLERRVAAISAEALVTIEALQLERANLRAERDAALASARKAQGLASVAGDLWNEMENVRQYWTGTDRQPWCQMLIDEYERLADIGVAALDKPTDPESAKMRGDDTKVDTMIRDERVAVQTDQEETRPLDGDAIEEIQHEP